MIRGLVFVVFGLLIPVVVLSQTHVTVLPEKVTAGGTVLITYNSESPEAKFAKAKSITAEFAEYSLEGIPSLAEISLTKNGTSWTGHHPLTRSTIFYQLRFVSKDVVDDNNENVWSGMVFGPEGKPARGAELHYANAMLFPGIPGFKMTPDVNRALVLAQFTADQYPDDWQIQSFYWAFLSMRTKMGDEAKAKVEQDLARIMTMERSNEEAVATLLVWYDRLGKKAYADSLRTTAMAANPKGVVARRMRQMEMMRERSPEKQVTLIESFVKDFPLIDSEKKGVMSQLISAYVTMKDYPKAFSVIDATPTFDANVDMALNGIAWELAETGNSIDTAQILAEKALKIIRNENAVPKPPYMSSTEWKKNRRMNLGMTLDTYGFILLKANKPSEAMKALAEAVDLLEGKEAEINERYMQSLVASKEYKRAVAKGAAFAKKGTTTEKLIGYYKEAFEKTNTSKKGFDATLAKDKSVALKAGESRMMKEMLDKPAPGFVLKDLAGKEVNFASLRGKVVVVDFWATWCGPCKDSFPFLQKVYEQYRSNASVVILALNTWERVSGSEREELVRKFLADNKYTFPVLYDDNTVTKYGVEGIPTKFVIDKQGNIRFKTVGFDGGEKMMAEMKTQIDLLLSDEFSKGVKR